MTAWAVVVTALALLADVHRPNSPALGSDSEPVAPIALAPRIPVPGVYVVGSGSDFRVGPNGQAIGSLTLTLPCVASVQFPWIPVSVGDTFSFRGSVGRGNQAVRVWLAGRFTDRRTALLTVTVRGPECSRRQVAFAARLR
jgi:hypothetical protein